MKRDDLLRVARRYLVPSGRTVIEVIPLEGEEGDEEAEGGEEEEAS